MLQGSRNILATISGYSAKPALFEPGEPLFWDDPYISKNMLEAHLNPEHDAASRRPETIDKEINNLITSGTIKPGDRVLDLGCGPGLYASRLCENGIKVTGVDISKRSIDYAVKYAAENSLEINYRCVNFFDIDYVNEFDAVLQAYGELGTFSDEKRDILLAKIHLALKPGGILMFDVTSTAPRPKEGPQNHWYIVDGGFWRPGRHLVLEQHFDYPEDYVRVDQYIVVDEKNISIYRTWIHNYTLNSIKPVLEKAGFHIVHAWNDLAGTPYKEGGDWIAIVARKRTKP
ncbi:MAG: cyclopropane-fatty-acyl-phospholipid synthase [Chloroflexi bacterium RBG_16_50_11]|nr:MAG: cyclopropane-fatty-acyl-phospholipid synthase [Chloroflexi bacterium RBG_16_50_11]